MSTQKHFYIDLNYISQYFLHLCAKLKQEGQRCPKRRAAQEILMDRQTDKKWTNEQTEVHQFRKQPSYDGDLSLCQV